MDQEIRNRLRSVVTQSRRLLEDAISQELEGKYGIFARKEIVTADPQAKMPHLSQEEQEARKDILDHYAHIQARGFKAKEALDQLVREVAFTHLNRLCAYKMMEAREVYVSGQRFRESVSRGVNSNGVKFYLAEHEEDERLFNTGQQDIAYRHYLDWLGGQLSEEIGVLFNPNDPANRLYPRQKTLDEVLELLNNGGIKSEEAELSDQWPQIWSQDETIGWVYQYFTPKELRDQARKESSAPRNSYELAFRNQFFTPRYVVEFLTDNTLGRIWYEMRKGDTRLNDQCRYMVRRPTEIFLKEGEQRPKDTTEGKDDLSQEELLKFPVYIPHRPKKDPRELRILDPACGSGHFLLYCFDLLLSIYEEAYADPDLGPALKKNYPTLEALKQDVPRLILAHNLHGIDIDLRASQIAALALWLRCQRSYQEMGLKKDRPQITRSNFVCAEPMPGEEQMLKEFVNQVEPKVLGQVVEVVFDKMKLAGEAGSLLKIEEEIRDAIREAKRQYAIGGISIQPTLFDKPSEPIGKVFSVKDITDTQFFEGAEAQVIEALRSYAEKAQKGQRLQRRLFSEDAVRGFAFVDLCQKRYDVLLMNPPYGEHSIISRKYADAAYSLSSHETYCCFMQRGIDLCNDTGLLGSLTSRTYLTFSTFADFRRQLLIASHIYAIADLGFGVLDSAMVETAASVISSHQKPNMESVFCRGIKRNDKHKWLAHLLAHPASGDMYIVSQNVFADIPGSPICYWAGTPLRRVFKELPSFEESGAKPTLGLVTGNNDRFLRLRWEVLPHESNPRWVTYCKGGDYSKYYDDPHLVVDWREGGKHIEETYGQAVRLRDPENYFQPGVNYPLVTVLGMNGRLMPKGCIFDNTAPTILQKVAGDLWIHLAFVNTRMFEYLVRLLTSSRHWQVGYLRPVPFPKISEPIIRDIETRVKCCLSIRQEWDSFSETSHLFHSPLASRATLPLVEGLCKLLDEWETRAVALAQHAFATDELIRTCFGLNDEFRDTLDEELAYNTMTYVSCDIKPELDSNLPDVSSLLTLSPSIAANPIRIKQQRQSKDEAARHSYRECASDLVSYLVGCIIGRWNISVCKTHSEQTGECEPAITLPSHPPAALVDPNGLPLQVVPESYPLSVVTDGILIDDGEHHSDIVGRVRESLEVLWSGQSDTVEKDLCEILCVKELRDYFRKPGKSGFWDDHISRYSKSRRYAPIYWLLQSSKKNYAIWLYYHRLDKDLLFKALVNYVEPKIRLETSRLESLRTQKSAAGDSGKEAKKLAKDVERQEDFLSELRDFEDKLRRAANLHLEPDLNDGVVLNIAPLWELVPWKEAKNYWDELMDGQYEWSSIGKQLRQKGLVK
jgi:hypothetical protein